MLSKKELFEKFKLAIEQEYAAYELYKNIAEESDDPILKKIFSDIAGDEFEHRKKIMDQYKRINDDFKGMQVVE